jgi:hypothetical protein
MRANLGLVLTARRFAPDHLALPDEADASDGRRLD